MKFAVGLPGVMRYPPVAQAWEAVLQPAEYQRFARVADDLGFDSLAVPEHIVVPNDLTDLMGSYWSHAMTVMSFVAGATSRIVVDSSVIVLPYHQPVVLAKAVSTLDVLSGGRVRLTVGVGHAEQEFVTLGVPFHQRGRITDEYLAAMVELWTSEKPSFAGRHVAFDSVAFEPKPVQAPHPPIWIGGNSEAAMRRAARHDGWYPWLIGPDELAPCLAFIRSLPEFEARDRPFDVAMPLDAVGVDEDHRPTGEPPERTDRRQKDDLLRRLDHLARSGVTWTSTPLPEARSFEEHLDNLHWFAETVLPEAR